MAKVMMIKFGGESDEFETLNRACQAVIGGSTPEMIPSVSKLIDVANKDKPCREGLIGLMLAAEYVGRLEMGELLCDIFNLVQRMESGDTNDRLTAWEELKQIRNKWQKENQADIKK